MRLIVLLLPTVLDSSLGITLEIAHAANRLCIAAGRPAMFDLRIATPRGVRQTTASGLTYSKLSPLPRPAPDDLVVIPGVMAAGSEDIGPWLASVEVGLAVDWLREAHGRGAWLAGGCTGTFVLAGTGLLDGAAATTTWWLATAFRRHFPAVDLDLEHMVVCAERILTAGAALAQADLMLHLVRRFGSQRLARDCSRFLLFDTRGSQAAYPIFSHLLRQDPFLQRVEDWLAGRLAERFKVEDLARALHVSQRTLTRRLRASIGISVVDIVHRMRAERAVHLLETTRLPMTEIAAQVGYADAASLRRLLLQKTGLGPRHIRARVRGVT